MKKIKGKKFTYDFEGCKIFFEDDLEKDYIHKYLYNESFYKLEDEDEEEYYKDIIIH